MIAVPQDIPHAVKPNPIGSGAYSFRIIAKPDYRLRANLQLSLDRGFRFEIVCVGLKIHFSHKFVDMVDAFLNITQMGLSVSKRQGRPLVWLSSEPAHASSQRRTDRP